MFLLQSFCWLEKRRVNKEKGKMKIMFPIEILILLHCISSTGQRKNKQYCKCLPSGFVHYYQSSDFKFFYIISFNQQDLSQIGITVWLVVELKFTRNIGCRGSKTICGLEPTLRASSHHYTRGITTIISYKDRP
jgi:hypothetical protein